MEYTMSRRLIEAVRDRPALYDKSDINYCNRHYVNVLWRDIGQEIEVDDFEARKKWTKLRDYFQKNYREVTTAERNGETAGKQKKWYLYDDMKFLVPHLTEKKDIFGSACTPSSSSPASDLDKVVKVFKSDTMFSDNEFYHHVPPQMTHHETPKIPPPEATAGRSATHHTATQQTTPPKKKKTCLTYYEPQTTRDEHGTHFYVPSVRRWYAKPNVSSRSNNNRDSEMSSSSQSPPTDTDNNSTLKDILDKLQKVADTLSKPIDEDEYFFKNIMGRMKILNTFEKMECQADIQMVVLKHLKRSVRTLRTQTQTAHNVTKAEVEMDHSSMTVPHEDQHEMEHDPTNVSLQDCK